VAMLDSFILTLRKYKGTFSQEFLTRKIAEWNGNAGGNRLPYCHVVVY